MSQNICMDYGALLNSIAFQYFFLWFSFNVGSDEKFLRVILFFFLLSRSTSSPLPGIRRMIFVFKFVSKKMSSGYGYSHNTNTSEQTNRNEKSVNFARCEQLWRGILIYVQHDQNCKHKSFKLCKQSISRWRQFKSRLYFILVSRYRYCNIYKVVVIESLSPHSFYSLCRSS